MPNRKQFRGLSRRDLLGVVGGGVLTTGLSAKIFAPETAQAEPELSKITADRALKQLMDGNQRYVTHKRTYPHQTERDIKTVAQAQHPFAILLGCADSRVSPELIFDQGLGDLFDIRVAGHVLDKAVKASIEYAAVELKVPLIVVLGHERCGAVKAAVEGKPLPGHIGDLVAAINPALVQIKNQTGDRLDNAVRANVQMVVKQLKSFQPIVADLVKRGQIKIVGARYDLDTGKVDLIA